MALTTRTFPFTCRGTAVAAATLAACSGAFAQETVTIIGRGSGSGSFGLAGFGDTPLARAPVQAAIIGQGLIADQGLTRYGDLGRVDASVGDAYNAEGYWSSLRVRGYELDNRFNVRRDGLPISGETAIALDNKERLELLKGTSGVQAGTSAPGGLLNLVVKRPNGNQRQVRLEVREHGAVLGAVDLGQRFGLDGTVGVRLNAAYEKLDPPVRNTQGQRSLLALAVDWQLGRDTLLQVELESSRQRQPSVAGFSMLGNEVPSPASIDPRRNLNDQPWRQDVVLNGDTASLRWQQRLNDTWRLTAHAMQQRLRSDDRTAFPYGVYDASYNCIDWCDRFAPGGGFTYWEYISDNERRTSSALLASLAGKLATGVIQHEIEFGMLKSAHRGRFQDQVFDIAGNGNVDGSVQTSPSAGFGDANTNRTESSTELFLRDAMQLSANWRLWAGLRHTQLKRSGVRTSADSDGGLRATDYTRRATTPWLGLAWQLAPKTMLYGSWGRGLETDVAPNRARYDNASESIAINSRQFELGLKHGDEQVEASLTLFDIDRGRTADLNSDGSPCTSAGGCRRVLDGSQRHRGIEATVAQQWSAWAVQASAMLLDATRSGSVQANVNGLRPENVPAATLRWSTEYRPAVVPGLALLASLAAQSNLVVLPYDQSARIPGWTRWDLALRWRQQITGSALTWRVGVDNATDRRAWKESPYQFSHVYLYPLAPRAWRASVQASF
jgi:iron complex outermembrane receptor protein